MLIGMALVLGACGVKGALKTPTQVEFEEQKRQKKEAEAQRKRGNQPPPEEESSWFDFDGLF